MNNDVRPGTYIDKVREETATYLKRLIREVETLTQNVTRIEGHNQRLVTELQFVRRELAARDDREQKLHEKLNEIRSESETYLAQFSLLEQHNTNLANLYVATYQLHGTLDREAVLDAIQEIVVNLVGSEDFGILERNADTGEFDLIAAVGPKGRAISANDSLVQRALTSGHSYISATPTTDETPACIPLAIDGEVVGVIVIRGLLPHKTAFEPLDQELFDLLASHAAAALYCSTLRDRVPALIGLAQ